MVCVWVTGHAGKIRNGAGVRSFTVAASQRGNVLLSIAAVSPSSNMHFVVYHEKKILREGTFSYQLQLFLCLQICTLSSIMKKCALETSFRNSSNVTGSVPPRSSTTAFQKLLPFNFFPKSCTSTRQRIEFQLTQYTPSSVSSKMHPCVFPFSRHCASIRRGAKKSKRANTLQARIPCHTACLS